jgi:molybdopterin converting factor small subunit
MRINAILKHGLTNTLEVDLPQDTTIRAIKTNMTYKIGLRLPESCVAVVNGNTVGDDYVINDGDEVVFERQAASKAA